jgi:hypothetical protein
MDPLVIDVSDPAAPEALAAAGLPIAAGALAEYYRVPRVVMSADMKALVAGATGCAAAHVAVALCGAVWPDDVFPVKTSQEQYSMLVPWTSFNGAACPLAGMRAAAPDLVTLVDVVAAAAAEHSARVAASDVRDVVLHMLVPTSARSVFAARVALGGAGAPAGGWWVPWLWPERRTAAWAMWYARAQYDALRFNTEPAVAVAAGFVVVETNKSSV